MTIDQSIFEDIEENLSILSVDEIKKRLEPLIKGIKITSPVFDPGAFLYRARKVTPTFNKQAGIRRSDLIYPPSHLVKMGRLNRNDQPMFYCSIHKESVFFELQGLQAGDELILTFWKTNERMLVNNIGYTEHVFQKLGAKRPLPQWKPPSLRLENNQAEVSLSQMSPAEVVAALSKDEGHEVREAFSRYFMSAVAQPESNKYKLTTAIGELHLGQIVNLKNQFAGVLYPSVRMWANGDNLALLPWYVDKHLEMRKAVHIRIDGQTDTSFSITSLDTAKELDGDGKLVWLGRLPNWTLQPQQEARFTLTPGIDEDGDYGTSKDGQPCHWVAVDAVTGRMIEAC